MQRKEDATFSQQNQTPQQSTDFSVESVGKEVDTDSAEQETVMQAANSPLSFSFGNMDVVQSKGNSAFDNLLGDSRDGELGTSDSQTSEKSGQSVNLDTIIQRSPEDDPIPLPDENKNQGKAFKEIIEDIKHYNNHILSYEPVRTGTLSDEKIKKEKLNTRVLALNDLREKIDQWQTDHPERKKTSTSNKNKRERRQAKRQVMADLKQQVISLRELIQTAIGTANNEIGFQDAPLLDNPKLKSQDENAHLAQQNSYVIEKNTQVTLFPARTVITLQEDTLIVELDQLNQPMPRVLLKQAPYFNKVAQVDVTKIKKGASARFQTVNRELFPHDKVPEPMDVTQYNLGDCYLQAALASIVATRPSHIKNIMRDQGDTVAVKLHRVKRENGGKTFNPEYIKVEKSIPKSASGKDLYNRGCLWVRMMEKAYAAGRFAGDRKKENELDTASYENISGGNSYHAFEVLTGQPSSYTSLAEQSDNDPTGQTMAVISKALKDNNVSSVGKVGVAINKLIFNQEAAKQNLEDRLATQITLSDVANAFTYGTVDEKAKKDSVLRALKGKLPGSLGSKQYTEFQVSTYFDIEKQLEQGKPVAVSTHKYLKADQSGFDGFAGEQKKNGLAGSHAYSVMDVCMSDDITSPEPGGKNYYMLLLRNPWGQYGRNYFYDYNNMDEDNNVAVQPVANDLSGTFWLELSELTKYFDGVHVGAKLAAD